MMLAISLCVIPGINMVLHSQIKEQLVVDSSSSPSYSTWVSNADPASDSNLDVTYDVYMWSVANPSAVLHDNAKPQMVQMGPYSYKVSSRPPPPPPRPPSCCVRVTMTINSSVLLTATRRCSPPPGGLSGLGSAAERNNSTQRL
jgi:hypothetical protein